MLVFYHNTITITLYFWIRPMDFINKTQLMGIVLFLIGSGILTYCNRYERETDAKLKDPKIRWAVIDGNKDALLKQKNFRGNIMTVVGFGVAIYGFILFLTNIK